MTVQTDRHLTLIDAASAARDTTAELHRLMVRVAVGAPPDQPSPAIMLEDIAELDALHETACDVYDGATAELDAARKALTEAASALTVAEDAWSKAGQQMDAAARAVSCARKAAGLVRTASGYVRAVQP